MRKTYKKNKAKNTRKHKSVRNKRRKRNYYLTGGAQFPAELKYWNEFFNDDDEKVKLNELRSFIQDAFGKGPEASFTDLCDIMRELVPTFHIPNPEPEPEPEPELAPGSKPKIIGTLLPNGTTVYNTKPNKPDPNASKNFYYLNAILCASFQLFGIIANKMITKETCKYKLIFKGGKAVQLVLRNIFNRIKINRNSDAYTVLQKLHQSEDIDVLLIPKPENIYDETEIKALAINISKLIEWFLHRDDTTRVSIQTPDDDPAIKNKTICKLSYILLGSDAMKAFSDIDFSPVSTSDFSDLESLSLSLSLPGRNDLGVLFECQKIEPLLKDKILYYTKYVYLLDKPDLQAKQVPKISRKGCLYFINKFGKAIISLNNGFHLERHPDLDKAGLNAINIAHLEEELRSIVFSNIDEEFSTIPEDLLIKIIDNLYGSGIETQHSSSQPLMPPTPISQSHLEQLPQYQQYQQYQQLTPEQLWYHQQQQQLWYHQQQQQLLREEQRKRQTQRSRPLPRQGQPSGHGLPPPPPRQELPPVHGQDSARRPGSSRGRAQGRSRR
jgi:hypothetical protein